MLEPGTIAPDAAVADPAGADHPLRDLVVQPTLIVFFRADCAVCRRVLPVYAGWRRYEPHIQVLGISLDGEGPTSRLLGETGVDLPTFHDPDPHPASQAFRVESLPAAVLLVEARIVWAGEGWAREEAHRLAERLASLAGDRPAVEGAGDLPDRLAGEPV